MKKEIKIIICAFAAIFFVSLTIKLFYSPTPQKSVQSASPDNTFRSAEETNLRPKSIPFEPADKPIVREPENVPQKDIDRTYRIITIFLIFFRFLNISQIYFYITIWYHILKYFRGAPSRALDICYNYLYARK